MMILRGFLISLANPQNLREQDLNSSKIAGALVKRLIGQRNSFKAIFRKVAYNWDKKLSSKS